MAPRLGSAGREHFCHCRRSTGQRPSRGFMSQGRKAAGPRGWRRGKPVGRDAREHRMRQPGPAGGGAGGGGAGERGALRHELGPFYLLPYFHLVVQVMRVGVSLGRGSTKADFLVKKRKVRNREEGTWLKRALVESILHLLKLGSYSTTAQKTGLVLPLTISVPKSHYKSCQRSTLSMTTD